MAPRTEAIVKPELLIWARESAGLSLEEAARKLRLKPERLHTWEQGAAHPTIAQLRKLGQVYKRPLAVFYLSEPPKTFKPLHDFRRLPGEVAGRESPGLKLEIRRARGRREAALELYQALGESPQELRLSTSLSGDLEVGARNLRQLLGVTYERQAGWRDPYEALNGWRSALEGLGILVFQATDVDLSEMRAFSLGEFPLPAVVVNIKDSPRARIFSMLHEFAHLASHSAGLCDLDEDRGRPPEELRVEVACNRLAGAILVPHTNLLREDVVAHRQPSAEWTDEELGTLASRYNVNREVILRRLLLAGRTSEGFYRKKRDELLERGLRHEKQTRGFAPPYSIAVSSAGPLFIRLVLNSYYQERITARDVSDYLQVRLKHMAKIEKAVVGHVVEFGAVA